MEEHGSSGFQARYVHGAKTDELLARITTTASTFYHHGALGNTVALTDNSGNVVERYTYDVFGAPTVKEPSGAVLAGTAVGNRFLFTGREYLPWLGLYDYRNRIYASDLGRFLQVDPQRFYAVIVISTGTCLTTP